MGRGQLAGTTRNDQLDIDALARKYRGKGQDDQQVYNTLRSLGYSSGESKKAVADLGPTNGRSASPPVGGPANPKPAAGGPGGQPGPPPAQGGGFSMPSLSPPDVSKVTLTPPKRLNGADLGGFLAGLLLYALALNYLQHGPDGVKGWVRAKFLNDPMSLPTADLPQTSSSSSSTVSPTKVQTPAAV